MAVCPRPFSVIAVWFAVNKHIFHCHVARRIGIMVTVNHHLQQYIQLETYIPLSLCDATWHSVTTTIHHWWKGNIYSIVTVLCDLGPVIVTHRIRQCKPLRVGTVYTVLYDRIKQHGISVRKTNSSLHEVVRMCSYSVWWMWTTLPVHKMQSTFAMSQHPEYILEKTHSSAHVSMTVQGEHRKYGTLHRSPRFVSGIRLL